MTSAKDQTVIVDGNNLVTISGAGKTRIFDLDNYTNFVVQRLTLQDGFVAAGEPEVTNRPSNSGAAIRHPWFGTLQAIDVRFVNNHCASRDGEIGGGAIYAGGLTRGGALGLRVCRQRRLERRRDPEPRLDPDHHRLPLLGQRGAGHGRRPVRQRRRASTSTA